MPVIFRPPNSWWWYDSRSNESAPARKLPPGQVVQPTNQPVDESGFYGLEDEYWQIVNEAGGYLVMHPVKIEDLNPAYGLTVSHTYQRVDQYWPHIAFDDEDKALIFKLTYL